MTYYLDTSSQTYLEYGLTDATTLVGDLSMIRLHNAPESGYATLSIRRALSKPNATSKWAYELGIGVGWIGAQTLPHLRTSLSWGRGMEWGDKSGWATVEASAVWDLTYAQHIAKIDMTLGIQITEVTAGMIQLYTAHMFDENVATIAPPVIFGPKKKQIPHPDRHRKSAWKPREHCGQTGPLARILGWVPAHENAETRVT